MSSLTIPWRQALAIVDLLKFGPKQRLSPREEWLVDTYHNGRPPAWAHGALGIELGDAIASRDFIDWREVRAEEWLERNSLSSWQDGDDIEDWYDRPPVNFEDLKAKLVVDYGIDAFERALAPTCSAAIKGRPSGRPAYFRRSPSSLAPEGHYPVAQLSLRKLG